MSGVGNFARLLPSLDVVAISHAPLESKPDFKFGEI